jgi:hypothetical protein
VSFTQKQNKLIQKTIKDSLQKKLQRYNPETSYMPFHYRLIGKDRMALFSFIHSLNTTFGTSIFEPVAEVLASSNFVFAQKQYIVGDKISEKAQSEVQQIMNDLTMGKNPDKFEEIERIRKVCNNERWTLKGMLDLDNELKVAEEFWDFLGGIGVYSKLLDAFEKVGIDLRPEIDEYFAKFRI